MRWGDQKGSKQKFVELPTSFLSRKTHAIYPKQGMQRCHGFLCTVQPCLHLADHQRLALSGPGSRNTKYRAKGHGPASVRANNGGQGQQRYVYVLFVFVISFGINCTLISLLKMLCYSIRISIVNIHRKTKLLV